MPSRIILFLLIILFLMAENQLFAQNTWSPYSRYGLGELAPQSLVSQTSMGDVATPQTSPWTLNLANPASLAFLIPKSLFDVGITAQQNRFTTATQDQKFTNSYLNNIAIGLKGAKRWGMSFGILPYSHVGYSMRDSVQDPTIGKVEYRYEGDGGLQRLYLANGFKLFSKNDSSVLAAGFNMSYIFGNINHDRTVLYPAGYYHSAITETWSVQDFAWDFGLLYKSRLTEKLKLTLAASFGAASNLNVDRDFFARTFSIASTGAAILKDTIKYELNQQDFIRLPKYHRYGVLLDVNDKWLLGTDFKFQEWSQFYGSFDSAGTSGLVNSSRIAVGAEYTPQSRVTVNAKILRMAHYRLGWHHESSNLLLNGTRIQDNGISFGVGLPLVKSMSMTSFNLGARIGTRGSSTPGLLRENYFILSVGLSMAPNNRDNWFVKRKID